MIYFTLQYCFPIYIYIYTIYEEFSPINSIHVGQSMTDRQCAIISLRSYLAFFVQQNIPTRISCCHGEWVLQKEYKKVQQDLDMLLDYMKLRFSLVKVLLLLLNV